MDYTATAKYVRTTPRKSRLVVDAVRDMVAEEASTVLLHMPKSASVPVRKVLESAIANAKGAGADPDKLRIKLIEVTEGPVMKRFRAVARGMAHGYKKRMSHIRVILTTDIKEK